MLNLTQMFKYGKALATTLEVTNLICAVEYLFRMGIYFAVCVIPEIFLLLMQALMQPKTYAYPPQSEQYSQILKLCTRYNENVVIFPQLVYKKEK